MKFLLKGDSQSPKRNSYPAFTSLRIKKDGTPYALIGATNSNYRGQRLKEDHYDKSKPFLSVTLTKEPLEKTIYASFKNYQDYLDNKPIKVVEVSASYSLGSDFVASDQCKYQNSCLNSAPSDNSLKSLLKKSCKKAEGKAVSMGELGPQQLCFSCNGLTAGPCRDENRPFTSKNFKMYADKVNRCQPEPTSPQSLTPQQDGVQVNQ